MTIKYRYNIGDILTFQGVKAWDMIRNAPTNRWREVVVIRGGNFISKISIYPELKAYGNMRNIIKMPKKLRIKEHRRVP